ncbi:DUF6473 family protein [uncultured Roseobacter sp.]|uniref:DUF6473 family protein n=1 Tax=uncultured Roseobacter sp. TaxID=114847 RepID=UPI00261CFA7A|nr:DUF6473 family protein [uncultured Roseobacter sp.]
MSYDVMSTGALDYAPCCYGNSKLLFRGPKRRLDAPYVAFLGGTETYGKFIKAPFPALVESGLGVNCVNFGILNAGVDVFVNDKTLIESASSAQMTVIQVVGAQNLSNRFYSVHPRRNDRFLTASAMLKTVYPEVDFAEFHFNRHMLGFLQEVSIDRFSVVRSELQMAWLARMRLLLSRISSPVVLVWIGDHAPMTEKEGQDCSVEASDPLFVTREMLDMLRQKVAAIVEVEATSEAVAAGTSGMVFNEMEAVAAGRMLGPQAHGEVARVLGPVLQDFV